MSLKVGSVGYATDQGLGILLKSFYDAGVVTEVAVIAHGSRPTHMEWYPRSELWTNLRSPQQIQRLKDLCDEVDVMLFFETPFAWELIPHCRSIGVRTFLMPMYECMPKALPYIPDRFICPSELDLKYYPTSSTFIPVPVSYPWRKREVAEVFVHNAGHGGLMGRNGTRELLDAIPLVKSPVKFIIRTQKDKSGGFNNLKSNDKVRVLVGTIPYEDLYSQGDAFVFPEKFNGLSLPLQEAYAAGMLVMAGNRFPMNRWLPTDPLIPVTGYRQSRIAPRCNEFEEAVYNPQDIANTIDSWYGRDISKYSEKGRKWAEANSWDCLRSKYVEELSR